MDRKKTLLSYFIVISLCMILSCGLFLLPYLPGALRDWRAARAKERKDEKAIAEELKKQEAAPKERENLKLRNVTYYTYDGEGRKTAREQYNTEGKLIRYEYYTYNGQGECTLEQSGSPDGGSAGSEVRRAYDEKGRLVLEQEYGNGQLKREYYLQKISDGSTRAVGQNYDKEGNQSSYSIIFFNENDDPVAAYDYNPEGEVTGCEKYRYDEEGQQVYYIYYNRGDESTTPLREIFTEYGEDRTVRIAFEPLGHLNSVHYAWLDGSKKAELYYLAGYSGGNHEDGIYILGQEGVKWNNELKFREGVWKTYDGDDEIYSLNCGSDRMNSCCAYWYEDGKKFRELKCTMDGGSSNTTVKRYVYDGNDRLTECYEYGVDRESFEEALQDNTRLRMEYAQDNNRLEKVILMDAGGEILREITFDMEQYGRIREWYDPLKEPLQVEDIVNMFTYK